jgi:hypothetical protein
VDLVGGVALAGLGAFEMGDEGRPLGGQVFVGVQGDLQRRAKDELRNLSQIRRAWRELFPPRDGHRVMYVIARSEATKQFRAAYADAASLIEAAPRS